LLESAFVQVKALYGHLEASEKLLRRLQMYTKVPLTTEMMDTIIQIMAEGSLCCSGDKARPNEEIYEEVDWKDRYGRHAEEVRQVD